MKQLVSVRTASGTRTNPLRVTRARAAIAAVMNGVDPDPADVEATADYRIDEQQLHLSTAVALRQILLSRPESAQMSRKSRRDRKLLINAHYLATALADACDGDQRTLRELLRSDRDWLAAAMLLGRLQVRFLDHICTQIDMAAGHRRVPPRLNSVPARKILGDGAGSSGDVTDGITLLEDYASGEWLHATSTVTVAGISGTAVVDAGPDLIPAAWSVRVAAPITVTAGVGLWPTQAVHDALLLCDEAVRWWVSSMTRELSGDNDQDLLLRIGPPLRQFLISPATVRIAAAIAARATGGLSAPARFASTLSSTLPATPLLPVSVDTLWPTTPSPGFTAQPGALAGMRFGGGPGAELAPDTSLKNCVETPDADRDTVTLLSLVPAGELDDEIEVTANIAVPQWQDVTCLVEAIRESGAVALRTPVVAYADQDIIRGDEHRLTLRARVRRGVAMRTRSGYAVLLAPGTRLALLGASTTKTHATLYLQVDDEISEQPPLPGEQPVTGGARRVRLAAVS